MTTASQLILTGLSMIGEKSVGDTLTTAEQTYWLARLNSMLDFWSTKRLNAYQILLESFPLVSGTVSYTIGSGGTFNTTRPTKLVDTCYVRDTANYDTTLKILPIESYRGIPIKSVGRTYPDYISYDTAYAAGLATIYLYPAPQAGLTLYINSWKQLQQFATVSDVLALPPGYQAAIEANFAVYAAAGYTTAQPELMKLAKETLAAIQSLNAPEAIMQLDSGLTGRAGGNIITGP